MSKQIFRKKVPHSFLFKLLDNICLKTDKYYVFDINAYKKLDFYKYNVPFTEYLKRYYHQSKHFYLERKLTYTSFTNIIRQICKDNGITFTSQTKYFESKYFIDYFIHHISIKNGLIDMETQTDETDEIFALEDCIGRMITCYPKDIQLPKVVGLLEDINLPEVIDLPEDSTTILQATL